MSAKLPEGQAPMRQLLLRLPADLQARVCAGAARASIAQGAKINVSAFIRETLSAALYTEECRARAKPKP